MKAVAACTCILFLIASTVSAARLNNRLILDGVLKKALEDLRPIFKDLVIEDTSISVINPDLQVNASIKDGLIENLDTFVTRRLTTTILPLKLTNLTLTWDKVEITGEYDLLANLDIPSLPDVTEIFGAGDFKIQLQNIFLTIAAKFVLVDGVVQIPEKGLSGFDIDIKESKVELENLLGGGEKGEIINKFLSFFIPQFVRDYKETFFESAHQQMIDIINKYLAGSK